MVECNVANTNKYNKMTNKIVLMNTARQRYRREHEDEIRFQAKSLFEKYKNEPLFIAGIMLYWAEGKMTENEPYNLELNNSDPKLLKLYCQFIRRYFNLIPNIQLRARLFAYTDMDEDRTKKFWSELLSIPLDKFIKSYVSNSRSIVTKNKLPYGTCSVYIASKDSRIIMATWIEKFANLYI